MRVVMFIPGEPHTANVIANLERPQETAAPWDEMRYLSAASCTAAAGAMRMRAGLGTAA
jgi:hypothetical protein